MTATRGPVLGALAVENQIDQGDVPARTITAAMVDAAASLSGKVLKSNGDGTASWLDDVTGSAPGGVDIPNLTQSVRDRFEKTAVAALDGSANGYWTTPDTAVFDITSTVDLRVRILPDSWTLNPNGMSLIAKHSAPSNKSYRFLIDNLGRPVFTFSVDGTTSIAALQGAKFIQNQVPPGVPVWLRCRAEPTGGAGGKARATFYYATTTVPVTADWVTIEFVDSATAGPWFSGSARVLVGLDDSVGGSQAWYKGKLYKAEIRDGSGTLIEDFNADALGLADTTMTGTNGHVWTAGSSVTVSLAQIDMASALSLFGMFDSKTYGQKSDRIRGTNGAITSGVNVLAGTFQGSADVGKVIRVVGAGAVTTRTDGAMTSGGTGASVFTSAGASFDRSIVGQQIVIPGAGAAGATLTTKVWGVISATQLRLKAPCSTSVSGATYTISKDLYSSITAATTTTATLADNAGTTIASGGRYFYGTDDAPAIKAAIAACEASTNNGGTVFVHGQSMVCSTIVVAETTNLIGLGGIGFSDTLGYGTTSLMPGVPGMVVFRSGVAGAGFGVRGSATASSTTFTDPDGAFTAGDVGKTIHILGAGTLTGSSVQQSHQTTIAGYTSATQVTLTAAAVTTTSPAVYSYESGIANLNGGPTISRIHIQGGEGQKCGIHIMDCNEWTLDKCTISDFYSGVGLYSDGIGGNCQYMDIHSSQFNDCMIGVKAYKGAPNFSGVCTMDGNSNRVDVIPGPGTIAVDCYNGCNMGGVVNVQAYETGVYVDGHGGGSNLVAPGLRVEGCIQGIVLAADGTNGGNGSIINCVSWSGSSIGGSATAKGLVLKSGVTNTVFNPGFYLTTDVDMYGSSDATALLSCIRVGDLHLRQTYAASNVSTDRTYDASSTTLTEVANVLGSLIADLRTQGVVK